MGDSPVVEHSRAARRSGGRSDAIRIVFYASVVFYISTYIDTIPKKEITTEHVHRSNKTVPLIFVFLHNNNNNFNTNKTEI